MPTVKILSVGSQSVCVLPRKIHVSVSALFRIVCVFLLVRMCVCLCVRTPALETQKYMILGHFVSGAHEINKAETLDRS